jgi:Subtilase family
MTEKGARTTAWPARLVSAIALTGALLTLASTSGPALATLAPRAVTLPSAPAYQALAVCGAPAPGRAGCLAYELAPSLESKAAAMLSPRARARLRPGAETTQQPQPVTPAALHSAYQLPDQPPTGAPQQTIALVDAYNDPSAAADLKVYDEHFRLPACTVANGCFKQLNQSGEATNLPFPQTKAALESRESTCKTSIAKETVVQRHEREVACFEVAEATGWGVEIATDVEVAHSVCETCHIRLVEADSAEYSALEAAERTAARPVAEGGVGATEISNSWGGEEPVVDSSAFDHPGIAITASAGDDGYLNWTEAEAAAGENRSYYSGADYPASSPHVVAVGGTELTLAESGARQSERVWNEDPNPEGGNSGGGGGGCSTVFAPQPWQREVPDWSSVGCGGSAQPRRAVADVAADGDPYSGVLVYDSGESKESLLVIGGTSVASPIIASTFALAGGAAKVAYPAETLYAHSGSAGFYDVTSGGNGRCDALYTGGCSGSMSPLSPLAPLDCGEGVLICNAAPGYDGPTGLGTPNGVAAFQASTFEGEQQAEGPTEEPEHKGGSEGEARSEGEGSGGSGEAPPAQSGGATASTGQAPTGTTQSSPSGEADESETEPTEGLAGAGRAAAVRLTDLALTPNALAALADRRQAIREISLTFELSAATRIRVTLSRLLIVGGHARWTPQRGAFAFAARRGHGHVRLRGDLVLAPGRYRVTLAPTRGLARSLSFALS